jgi:hypothetical protein
MQVNGDLTLTSENLQIIQSPDILLKVKSEKRAKEFSGWNSHDGEKWKQHKTVYSECLCISVHGDWKILGPLNFSVGFNLIVALDFWLGHYEDS